MSFLWRREWAGLYAHRCNRYRCNWLTCIVGLYFTVMIGLVLFTNKRQCRKFQWPFKDQIYLLFYLIYRDWDLDFILINYIRCRWKHLRNFRSCDPKQACELFCYLRAQPFQTHECLGSTGTVSCWKPWWSSRLYPNFKGEEKCSSFNLKSLLIKIFWKDSECWSLPLVVNYPTWTETDNTGWHALFFDAIEHYNKLSKT